MGMGGLAGFKAHLMHVGNLNNKGTQALLASDFFIINKIIEGSSVSVSTTDIEGVNRLNLPFDVVLPPAVDIPYMKADELVNRFNLDRGGFSYRLLVSALLVFMALQTFFMLFSIIFEKIGLKPVYRGGLIRRIKESDLVISHSDENFKETASLLPLNPIWTVTWWSMLFSRTLDIMVARAFGKPIVMFPNSVGPFRTWIGVFLSRFSLNECDYLLIRDPVSYRIVGELKIRTPKILTYDTALLYSSYENESESKFSKPTVGVSPGVYSQSLSKIEVENYLLSHAKALDAIIEKHKVFVVFLPHYISGFSDDDLDISMSIVDLMKNKNRTKIITTNSVREFKLLLDQMDMVISSKMHPAVLAATGYVPIMCVAYDHKQTAFFQRLNMIDCTINIRNVTFESLLSTMEKTWNQRAKLQESLRLQIPRWQKDVNSAIKNVITRYNHPNS
jgi:polysaccharide pyruvyl transferase WcaK-like protein